MTPICNLSREGFSLRKECHGRRAKVKRAEYRQLQNWHLNILSLAQDGSREQIGNTEHGNKSSIPGLQWREDLAAP